MDYAALIGLGVQLLERLFEHMKNNTGVEISEDALAGLAKLKEFHGQLVTKASLDSLRG